MRVLLGIIFGVLLTIGYDASTGGTYELGRCQCELAGMLPTRARNTWNKLATR